MAVSRTGERLIFIISQPRSGSTLLQKILGTHSQISTCVEPWLLLPLVYILRKDGIRAEYNEFSRNINILEFLDSIPHGRDHYLEGTRLLMSNIYNKAMTDTDNYFLDKTPRYYLIIPELAELFPDAKFVFLFRNPLSVLASMHTTWKSVMGLLDSRFKKDLLRAPNLLISGKKMLDNRAFSISYESLVKNPEDELKSLCNWLSIPYQSTMMEYGGHDASRWVLGDQKTVYEYDRPITEKIDKWVEFIQSAQNWRYANCYLDYLGPDTVEQLGYSYDYLKDILISHKPSILTRTFTLPFFFSMSAHNILRKIYRRFVFKEAIF